MSPLLSVRNLNVSIGSIEILKRISFDVARGQCFGVVGESGSGKSMTALAVMGLLPDAAARSGSARMDGTDLLELSERRMCRVRGKRIGMIFQEPMTALNPVHSIGSQVAEALMLHAGMDRSKAHDVAAEKLERVELPTSRFPLGLYPHELSGGQRQRVCIALAIALRPALLIADEPTTALDVSTQDQILKLLRSLVDEEGMSLMLITHDLAVIARMADRAMVMQSGRIVEHSGTEELFRNMQHPYTRKLFAASGHVPERESRQDESIILEISNAVREHTLPRRHLFDTPTVNRAVDGVSFTIRRGESLGLVGESGCGKSTLARAILGLDPLQGGSIVLDGMPLDAGGKIAGETRRKMQVVFQDPYGSFNPRHRVERLVAEPFHLESVRSSRSERRDRVLSALTDVGLQSSDMTKFIHEFSGGQRQRIAIARALVLRPALIVLDEAVSALDVSIRAQILDLLAELQRRHGLAYLFISHDLGVVNAIADRVLVMKQGSIVEEGETASVFESPQDPYTRRLVAASPKIPSTWMPGASSRC